MPRVEVIEFNGLKYRRYPDSPRLELRKYHLRKGGYRLHRAIWEFHHGPIPDGHHVHHRDENTLNNDIANLDCISEFDHLSGHMSPEKREAARKRFSHARRAAAKWHGSSAGLAWHSEHGKRTWEKRQPLAKTCDQCGGGFESLGRRDGDRFCSNACKSAWRRASGVDDVNRPCSECGDLFRVNKYETVATCSNPCRQRLRNRTRRASLQPEG